MSKREFALMLLRYAYLGVALAGAIFLLGAIVNIINPDRGFTLRRPNDTIIMANTRLTKKIYDAKSPLVIDAREFYQHEEQRVTGSICIPVQDYRFMREDSRSAIEAVDTIILYCRNKRCPKARALAETIAGDYPTHMLYVMVNGIEAWSAMGFPVETKIAAATPKGAVNGE